MAFQRYTLPSGKILMLTTGEANALDAMIDDVDHHHCDLHPVERPKGASRQIMYSLAGAGALVRVRDDDDHYLYARCFWGQACPHLGGHHDDAYRTNLLPPSRNLQTLLAAAVAAGWVDTFHDTDRRTVTFERGNVSIEARVSAYGRLLELAYDDHEVHPPTMESFLGVLRRPVVDAPRRVMV